MNAFQHRGAAKVSGGGCPLPDTAGGPPNHPNHAAEKVSVLGTVHSAFCSLLRGVLIRAFRPKAKFVLQGDEKSKPQREYKRVSTSVVGEMLRVERGGGGGGVRVLQLELTS